MLTREDFAKLFSSGQTDQINEAYSQATPDEQQQYLQWLEEANPAETPGEDDVLSEAGEILGDTTTEDEANTEIESTIRKMMETIQPAVANPRDIAATKRSQRSNMLRSIRGKYRLMEEFTITECARRIGRDPMEVSAYLISEIQRGSGTFTYIPETNKFFLDNPFL